MTDDPNFDRPDPQDFTDSSPSPADDAHLGVVGDVLQQYGIRCVVVRYDGCGDSGGIEEIGYEPDKIAVPAWAEEQLQEVAEHYCPDGYENNEGGYGTLTLYPFEGLAELAHSDRDEDAQPMDANAVSLPAELQQQLSGLGASVVTAYFGGYGDSGLLEEVTIQPESIRLGDELAESLEEFLLDQLPGGWEINEGSYGTFTVDVPSGQVEVDAYWRVERERDPEVTRWRWR